MKKSIGLKGLTAIIGLSAASVAMADVTGTANVTSEYVFRGISSSGGAAVQGSLDYAHESGIYGGLWASNVAPLISDGNELDLIVGWSGDVYEGLGLDLGAIYYLFSEDGQIDASGTDESLDYWEIYAGGSFGPVSLTVYYADDFFNSDGAAIGPTVAGVTPTGDGGMIYVTADYTLAIKEDLDLAFQVGHNSGDGIESFLFAAGSTDDTYIDYSIVLTKGLENGFAFSFGVVDTNIDGTGTVQTFSAPSGGGAVTATAASPVSIEDDPKFFVSLSKEFDI